MNELIIIPAYNEEGNIQKVVDNLIRNYPEYDYVIINDGSKDKTAEICRRNCYNYIDLPVNLGLAGGFRAGMKYAQRNGYDAAIQFDGDGQHDPKYIKKMIEVMLNEKMDIVIGSRFINEHRPRSLRMFGNILIEGCILITTGRKIKDPTSGMRIYNKRMIEKLANTINYGPEPDTLAYLIRCGAKVKEVQVDMHEREAGESYLNSIRSMEYMLHMILSILIIQWFRKKGL